MTSDAKSADWALDAVLERDTRPVGDMALCRVLLSRDANYPWLLLVPRRPGATEIIDLDTADQAQLTSEIAECSRVLKALNTCDKLNIAAIGNVVPQFHVHIIARRRDDVAWPKPVWNVAPAKAYDDAAVATLLNQLRLRLTSYHL